MWDDISNIKAQGSNYSNLTKSEREVLKNLSEDKSIIIKPADKGSAVVVWDREDYIKEAPKQLNDQNVYRKVKVKANDNHIRIWLRLDHDCEVNLWSSQNRP